LPRQRPITALTAFTLRDGPRERIIYREWVRTARKKTKAEDKAITVILVLAMFVTFIVLGRYINRNVSKPVFETAPRAEADGLKVQPIVASDEADQRVRAAIDRRQFERRKRAA
jgi:hypothetical protein